MFSLESVERNLMTAGKTPSSTSAYQVLLAAFPAMHASAYRLLRLLASVCRGALTPLHAGLTSLAAASLHRIASEDSESFASGTLCSLRSEVGHLSDPSIDSTSTMAFFSPDSVSVAV